MKDISILFVFWLAVGMKYNGRDRMEMREQFMQGKEVSTARKQLTYSQWNPSRRESNREPRIMEERENPFWS